jgi:glycerophosphoryl diester phosphodiesterase
VSVIAHRGASAHALEHTLEAYDLAIEMGADMLEIDARTTSDGELVAVHDPTLARTTGDPRQLSAMPSAELADIEPSLRPPTLDGIFRRYGHRTSYWVDMKDPDEDGERRLLEVLDDHDMHGHVRVQSFEPPCLIRLAERAPSLRLGQLYRRAVEPEAVLADLDRFAEIGVAIGRASELIDETLVEAAHARGLAVHAYVVNDEDEMERMIALGASALITDVPDRCRRVVDGLLTAAG